MSLLSPKMQRAVRINENQVMMLAEKARYERRTCGYLYKRSSDSSRWRQRWFNLYQNMLFYYENETSNRLSGVILLEGSYCERLVLTSEKTKEPDLKYCLSITYRRENQRQYELRAETAEECKTWIEAIRLASFNKMLLEREELEQKHRHLLQIVESEKTAKWQYTQQCEELTTEIKKLRNELCTLKKEWRIMPSVDSTVAEDSDEIRKIKKVQSFFRGWLCRRRWKQIVEEYIKSPHAESMRKRNSLVFRMVEAEEEYVSQLNDLVTGFLRPFKMAASSKMPPCSHEDVNSIFLNSETILFLHQIFLKGLSARMESWPTLVLGDLFDILLPMLSIYQEYVRNHHFSLQVLTECKQRTQFSTFLSRLENKPTYQNRSMETFLTYPMHQIPRYIITLHELLAHTPHNHVERRSLDEARKQLERLSRQMHDEVSETENLRKNLAIERMISQHCDILLDVNQVFVRQGKPATECNRHCTRSISESSAATTFLTTSAHTKADGARARSPSPESQRERSLSCFQLDNQRSPSASAFPRLSIDFPRDKRSVFLSVDAEDACHSPPQSQRRRALSYSVGPGSQPPLSSEAHARHRHSLQQAQHRPSAPNCFGYDRGTTDSTPPVTRKTSGMWLEVPNTVKTDSVALAVGQQTKTRRQSARSLPVSHVQRQRRHSSATGGPHRPSS